MADVKLLDLAPSTKSTKKKEAPIGGMPDGEPILNPKWLVFSPADKYRTAQYALFTITNAEPVKVAYRLRTRDRLFPQLSHSHGVLASKESVEIVCYIPSHDQWPRDIVEYSGKVHKIVVETLTVPDSMTVPQNQKDLVNAVRRLFHNTASKAQLTRLYLKLKILLPSVPAGSPPKKASSTTF
ncbi:unnamed protein product [Bursaphelenchus okinawaensis]|uniref:MSP domain-containing protein n=1 Tax=Bursaphelenchus okinawaensis TaxID=465554 RepID=A0A811K2K9_9BILA|nr:unnamed protein product [Bursaphelenchus okinawaensis]CAG9090787.1 unnamed protein product [Bursaphelenchus okinawaensis]